ncbi:AAA family ATPase [Clostridium sp.]|uniref:AAA family ATPase n=1 Tax=Clostridium sp. TaxID=1506 RepID=UPI003D6DA086
MKITGLDIRDFGVFQGEKLENLGSGIIVIGGANRSGKTSLMQVLRNMPFGLSQSSNIPPAKFKYDVRCDLLTEEGEKVNVLLNGFSNPEIVYSGESVNKSSKGLYNIDKGTYKELFTISLDELNKSSGSEDSNLQYILLGAGFKHIVKIPEVAKKLREKANVIGGTRGNPSTKMFKPFVENIKKGVEGRKKSMALLDTFVQKKNILQQLEDTIILKETVLQTSNNNITKLEFLKHNFELNNNKQDLEARLLVYHFSDGEIFEYNIERANALKSQYNRELTHYNADNYEFQRGAAVSDISKESLLQNKVQINSFYNGISGLKEMTKNVLSMQDEYNERTQSLMNKIKKANDNWTSFSDVIEINCDEVQQDILNRNIEGFKKTEGERIAYNKRIQELKIQGEIIEKQNAPYDFGAALKKYFYFTLIIMILGFGLYFMDKLLGVSIIVMGAIGTSVYLFINYSSSKQITKQNMDIKVQMDNSQVSFNEALAQLKEIEVDLRSLENIMDEYRDILKLDGRVTEEGIKDYFKMAAYLKDEISHYNLLDKKLNKQFSDLCESLNSIVKVLVKFPVFSSMSLEGINTDNIQNACDDILLKVEIVYKHLILGEKTENSFSKLTMVHEEILKFLKKDDSEDIVFDIENYIVQGEKYIKYKNLNMELQITQEKLLQGLRSQPIKRILYDKNENRKEVDENKSLLKIIQDLYKQYQSSDELSYEYEILRCEIKVLLEDLDSLKNRKQTLKDEIQALNSDEMLLQKQEAIRQARTQLRPLAERYAIYNTAALFLEKIRERFLENTKDNLLKGASEILSDITSGEYKDIMPMEDLMQGDFKTVLKDERIMASSKQLSRGTREQLFLAVRISRIKEIQPALPVILDDSFVNFDIAHTKNTVKALVELAKTHQIIVLTCHGVLVDLISAQSKAAQYFKLDKGKFTKSSGGELVEYLNEL